MNMESSRTTRALGELQTLYHLHPEFRDVVVEGRDDAAWLRWYISEHGLNHVKVFAVDDRVTVPRELVLPAHDEVNARGRVIALAAAFDSWGFEHPSLTCVIDSDFDLLEERSYPVPILRTDHAAMEIYGLADRPLTKFLISSAKAEVTASDLISFLKPAWAALYALRYVLHHHTDGIRVPDTFAKRFIDSAGNVLLDLRGLLTACSPSPTRDKMAELLDLHAEYLDKIPDDGLQGIRGHDVAPMIIKFLGLKNTMAIPAEIERLMRQSIELKDIEEFDLFKSLRARLAE